LIFDLLTPKIEASILVPINAESLLKFNPVIFKISKYVQYFSTQCINNVQDARTDTQTDTHTALVHTASSYYVGGGRIN